jgi:hypothetical protein
MDSTRALISIAVLLCTLWLAGRVAQLSVWAVPPPVQSAPPVLALAHAPISIPQAVKLVQERYRGKVVRTDTRQEGGHTIYIMRVLSDTGLVRTVRVDADEGTIH